MQGGETRRQSEVSFSLPMGGFNTVYKAVEAFEDTGIRLFGLI